MLMLPSVCLLPAHPCLCVFLISRHLHFPQVGVRLRGGGRNGVPVTKSCSSKARVLFLAPVTDLEGALAPTLLGRRAAPTHSSQPPAALAVPPCPLLDFRPVASPAIVSLPPWPSRMPASAWSPGRREILRPCQPDCPATPINVTTAAKTFLSPHLF